MRERAPAARLAVSRKLLAASTLVALLALFSISPPAAWAQGVAMATVSPLPASDYSVRSACSPRSGGATCLALELVPQTPAARAHSHPLGMTRRVAIDATGAAELCQKHLAAEGCYGLRPQDLHSAYALPTTAAVPQTIAIVDAFNDPTIVRDLKIYDEEFNLPPCTVANHCFTRINQQGKRRPLPETNGGWAQEISLDVEIAHATCQNCHILLVEAQSENPQDLEAAEDRAAAAGASEISDSWSELESKPANDSAAFDHPGIVITAATGDVGYLNWAAPSPAERGAVNYPASSPHVVAVGGTRLTMSSPAGTWNGETVWNGDGAGGGKGATGGGCSERFTAPFWQQELPGFSAAGCPSKRAVADVAADGDPYTGVAVYDSTPNEEGRAPHWGTVGGTSLASPLIAAAFALAGGAGGVEYPARTLYENELRVPASLHDVESGSSGDCAKPFNAEGVSGCSTLEEGLSCSGHAICVAGPGYDGPSGVGTPNGIGAFEPTGAPLKKAQLIEYASTAPASARLGGPTYTVSATASSGLPVSFSSGTPTACSLQGAIVTFIGVGECTIDASQTGNSEYRAAPQAQQSFAVGKGTQVISFTSSAPSSATVAGGAYAVAATASSGLPVTLSSGTPSVCSLDASTVAFIGVGECTIDANQAGNPEYEAAPEARQSFAVGPKATLVAPLPAASSGTLAFSSASAPTPTPDSNFSLPGKPTVDRKTGAITFPVSVSEPGTLSWLLTYPNGSFGVVQAAKAGCKSGQIRLNRKCRAAKIVFATGSMVVVAKGIVRLTVRPGPLAMAALRAAVKKRQGLLVTATLKFQSRRGGRPVSHTRSLKDGFRS